jgi:putative transcriptional regulator
MKNTLPDLRAERGWTQGQLAERLKVSRQTVNAIETERYEPSLSLAFTIAKLFDKPIEAIFLPKSR